MPFLPKKWISALDGLLLPLGWLWTEPIEPDVIGKGIIGSGRADVSEALNGW